MKRIIAIIMSAVVCSANAADHELAPGEWTFDYLISGPRDARPVVHGDNREMYFQFPDGVKPTAFSATSCFGTNFTAKWENRGPYYVIPHPGRSVSVKTNHGTIKVEDRELCSAQLITAQREALSPPKRPSQDAAPQKRNDSSTLAGGSLAEHGKPGGPEGYPRQPRGGEAAATREAGKPTEQPSKSTPIVYKLEVQNGESLRGVLSKAVKDWGINLSWGLGRDRLSTRDFRFSGSSPGEVIDQTLKAFRLRGWLSADSNTLYIIKESE